jgi:hypothetical protein
MTGRATDSELGELLLRLQGKQVRITFAACMSSRRSTKFGIEIDIGRCKPSKAKRFDFGDIYVTK